MNPGPWGMVQTGVPFGEVSLVREWLGIDATIRRPKVLHPDRPVEGFLCQRREVSGSRFLRDYSLGNPTTQVTESTHGQKGRFLDLVESADLLASKCSGSLLVEDSPNNRVNVTVSVPSESLVFQSPQEGVKFVASYFKASDEEPILSYYSQISEANSPHGIPLSYYLRCREMHLDLVNAA